jgi:DNA topoisomerase-3
METAGKQVDDDELRDALKENGIGRPSTRAAIIETLFKRNYIRKEKKNLMATPTGIDLIGAIDVELLKSVELTGQWEKKLREIEKGSFSARQFIDELKAMVTDVVAQVKNDTSRRTVTVVEKPTEPAPKEKSAPKEKKERAPRAPKAPDTPKPEAAAPTTPQPEVCPLCGKGTVIKGKTAFGCSEWKSGCGFRRAF